MTDRELLIKISKEINEHLQKEPDDKYFNLEVVNDRTVELTYNYFGVEDILFIHTERSEWMSYKNLTGKSPDPDGTVIGNLGSGKKFTFKLKGVDAEPIIHSTKNDEGEQEPNKPFNGFKGFWYSRHVPESSELKKLCDVGQDRDDSVSAMIEVIDSGRKVIPSLGSFNKNDSDDRLRKRVAWSKGNFGQVGWNNIEFINLRDEPTSIGISTKQLEVIHNEAKSLYECQSTFMFTRSALLKGLVPSSMDLVGCNFYPFFPKDAEDGYIQIWSYKDFKNHADQVFSKTRKANKNVKFVITAQTFYSYNESKWRQPEPETAEWYIRYAQESGDIVGLLFWKWDNYKWMGLESMPKLEQSWVNELGNI